MDTERKFTTGNCFRSDREAFYQYLLSMGYTKKSLETYKCTMKRVGQFMSARNQVQYSSGVGKAFLSERMRFGQHTPIKLREMR